VSLETSSLNLGFSRAWSRVGDAKLWLLKLEIRRTLALGGSTIATFPRVMDGWRGIPCVMEDKGGSI
jgi:hypothetical protein